MAEKGLRDRSTAEYNISFSCSDVVSAFQYVSIYIVPQGRRDWLIRFRQSPKMTTPANCPVAELRALANLINASIDKIQTALLARGQTYPLSEEPFTPQSEAARMAPDIMQEGSIIVAAAAQLITATRPPPLTLGVISCKVGSGVRSVYMWDLNGFVDSISLYPPFASPSTLMWRKFFAKRGHRFVVIGSQCM